MKRACVVCVSFVAAFSLHAAFCPAYLDDFRLDKPAEGEEKPTK